MRLDDIDKIFDDIPGFRIVDSLKLEESGVDPIGLRQLNLDLMDATVPGINNVTRHIRPYTFMAWAWWRATSLAKVHDLDPVQVADLVDRYEAIYAWSHYLAGRPFRGAVAIRKWLTGKDGSFTFEGASWEGYKKERTGFMAPTEYGPSIKALHFLKPEGGLFDWATEAGEAIQTIDAIISRSVPHHILQPAPPTVEPHEIESLAEDLPIDEPSEPEKTVFRLLFHGYGSDERAGKDIKRRKATIDLIRSFMIEDGPLGVEDLRRQFAAGRQDGSSDQLAKSSIMLCHLQARQLQRLATETMMRWIETFLAETKYASRTIDEIVTAAHEAAVGADADYAASANVGDFLGRIHEIGSEQGWPASANDESIDVIGLMGSVRLAQYNDLSMLPALVIRSFAVVRAVTLGFSGQPLPDGVLNSIEARPDRMPMGLMVRRMDALSDRPLQSLWKEIIEGWIIGQHVHWSAVRGGDGKKRLRIGLEGDGWMLVRANPSGGFEATPDRLATLLSLGAACGIFNETEDGLYEAA